MQASFGTKVAVIAWEWQNAPHSESHRVAVTHNFEQPRTGGPPMSRLFIAAVAAILMLPGCSADLQSSARNNGTAPPSSETSRPAIGTDQPASSSIAVPAGTRVNVRLNTGLNSGRNQS